MIQIHTNQSNFLWNVWIWIAFPSIWLLTNDLRLKCWVSSKDSANSSQVLPWATPTQKMKQLRKWFDCVPWSEGHFQRKRHLPNRPFRGGFLIVFRGGKNWGCLPLRIKDEDLFKMKPWTKECLEIHEWLEAKLKIRHWVCKKKHLNKSACDVQAHPNFPIEREHTTRTQHAHDRHSHPQTPNPQNKESFSCKIIQNLGWMANLPSKTWILMFKL